MLKIKRQYFKIQQNVHYIFGNMIRDWKGASDNIIRTPNQISRSIKNAFTSMDNFIYSICSRVLCPSLQHDFIAFDICDLLYRQFRFCFYMTHLLISFI